MDNSFTHPFPVLSILSQKGGAGKTTLAIHLAVLAEKAGIKTVLLDLDPQASAALWSDNRPGNNGPDVQPVPATRLHSALDQARASNASLVIIDTPAQTEGTALAAAKNADLILVPCRTTLLDLGAIPATLDLAAIAQVPAIIILNALSPRSQLTQEARDFIQAKGFNVAPVTLGQRVAFVRPLTEGRTAGEYEPKSKAAEESDSLFSWLLQQLRLKATEPPTSLEGVP